MNPDPRVTYWAGNREVGSGFIPPASKTFTIQMTKLHPFFCAVCGGHLMVWQWSTGTLGYDWPEMVRERSRYVEEALRRYALDHRCPERWQRRAFRHLVVAHVALDPERYTRQRWFDANEFVPLTWRRFRRYYRRR